LTAANQQRILDTFTRREDIAHFSRVVPYDDIVANSYNISVSSYVEQEDTSEAVDITALNAEITRIVARQSELRKQIDTVVMDLERPSDETV
jgi:type I restriction enzyme M protein